jgi:uncharacterized iron-regulated protein
MTSEARVLEHQESLDALLGFDVVFVGEVHDSPVAHRAELELLSGLSERDPRLVLALEMFDRDVQDALDAYVKGEIPEDEFLAGSRPWPSYADDYRPLVELAKARGLPVVGASVPRRAAAAVARANAISAEVLGEDGVFLPGKVHLGSRPYRKRFMDIMADMPRRAPMRSMNADGLFKAQVLKDAVMAASLEPFLDRRVLFCCGQFHSDYRLGIPYQLRKSHPELKIAVVAFSSAAEGLPMGDRARLADFIWLEAGEAPQGRP